MLFREASADKQHAQELLDTAVKNVELDANVARNGSAVLTPTEVSVAASQAEVDALRENLDKPPSRPVSEAATVSPELALEEDDQRLEQLTLQKSLADALALAEELLDAAVKNIELDVNQAARNGSAVLTPTEVSVAASQAEVDALRENLDKPPSRPVSEVTEKQTVQREIASREAASRDVVTPDAGEILAHELLDTAVKNVELDEAVRNGSAVLTPTEVSVAASQAEVDALRENLDKPPSRPVSEAATVSPELALEEDDQRLEQLTLQKSLADALALAEVTEKETVQREIASQQPPSRDIVTPDVGETLAHELLDTAVKNVELDANEVVRNGSTVFTPTEVSVAASQAEVDALRENLDKPPSRPVSEAATVSPELALEEDDQRAHTAEVAGRRFGSGRGRAAGSSGGRGRRERRAPRPGDAGLRPDRQRGGCTDTPSNISQQSKSEVAEAGQRFVQDFLAAGMQQALQAKHEGSEIFTDFSDANTAHLQEPQRFANPSKAPSEITIVPGRDPKTKDELLDEINVLASSLTIGPKDPEVEASHVATEGSMLVQLPVDVKELVRPASGNASSVAVSEEDHSASQLVKAAVAVAARTEISEAVANNAGPTEEDSAQEALVEAAKQAVAGYGELVAQEILDEALRELRHRSEEAGTDPEQYLAAVAVAGGRNWAEVRAGPSGGRAASHTGERAQRKLRDPVGVRLCPAENSTGAHSAALWPALGGHHRSWTRCQDQG
ncbi:unnamed protein product [Effrenium voratum]|nr:unnamed protein product [Effrenium voratum]